ncbi:DUF922 domain-containing protein [Paracrocinitomix mangrovi]|uniref:DUF922 domain-containing protein n=1 Tax=Paracrocinitomix mangrovi TaxID=2862509 RepID=UPI001C8DEBDC|nr:DUF922 domain-containing protein [Paracrocinitomix mangrovi]UKN03537.1 DUF922 domain-containing protein [Paracrocinitomix mangrovi]
MNRLLIIFLLFIASTQVLGQSDNQLTWSNRKLKWADFKGDIPADSKFHALTHSVIDLKYHAEGNNVTFEIKTVFEKLKSWKKEEADTYLLQHEQLHFDITEYYSRILRKRIKTHRFKGINTFSSEVSAIFNQIYKDANEMQLAYDKETEHSINKKKQKKWNKKIASSMKKLDNYKNPKIKINISYLTNKSI